MEKVLESAVAAKMVTYDISVEDLGFMTVTHEDRRKSRAAAKLDALAGAEPSLKPFVRRRRSDAEEQH